MIDDLFARFDGAFADSTLKAYRADFGQYSDWCSANNLRPLEIQGNEFVGFIEHMALTLSSATIRRHVASISTVLRLSERHDVTKSASVVLALKQAGPLTRELLEKLLSVCDGSSRGLRDRLMLRLGYETMRRRAELCGLRFEDLEVLPNGKAALRLRFSKTDQCGVGKLLPVSDELLADIRRWGERAGMSSYLLRRVYRKDVIGNDLDPAAINRMATGFAGARRAGTWRQA
jgi:integrase